MEDFSDKLIKEYEPVEYAQDGRILSINLPSFVEALDRQNNQAINTIRLMDFVKTLGTNKSGGKNGIFRLQCFINAYLQEQALIEANPGTLKFGNDDHYELTRGSTGTNAPDFIYQDKYTIDAKINSSIDSYKNLLGTTNCHNADYVLVYLLAESLWVFAKKSEKYLTLHTVDKLAETDPWLLDLNLPKAFKTFKFMVNRDDTDDQVPETVTYTSWYRSAK